MRVSSVAVILDSVCKYVLEMTVQASEMWGSRTVSCLVWGREGESGAERSNCNANLGRKEGENGTVGQIRSGNTYLRIKRKSLSSFPNFLSYFLNPSVCQKGLRLLWVPIV